MKKKTSIIAAFTPEAVLKRKVRTHLRKIGFSKSSDGSLLPPSSSKETVRELHADQRKKILKAQHAFIKEAYAQHSRVYAQLRLAVGYRPAKPADRQQIAGAGR